MLLAAARHRGTDAHRRMCERTNREEEPTPSGNGSKPSWGFHVAVEIAAHGRLRRTSRSRPSNVLPPKEIGMTKTIGVLTAILLIAGVTDAQDRSQAKPTAPSTADAVLVAKERALLDAVAKADKASFESLVLPEGVWTSTQGFIPLKQLVDGLDSFSIGKWEIVNPHVTWLGTDSAILLYAWTGTGTFQNRPLAPTRLASTVWTRRNGKWLAVHHQETDLEK
jgi:hypothetical protein